MTRIEIIVIVSDIFEKEVKKRPRTSACFFASLPESHMEHIALTEETNRLTTQYIAENVGPTSLDECKHIALASFAHADALVSWNFRHIVNATRIRGYNSVNMKLGYAQMDIRPPL